MQPALILKDPCNLYHYIHGFRMIFNTDGQYFPKQCQWIGFCNGTLLTMCEVGTEFLGYFSCI
jgi:hypothetical protein